MTGQTGAGGINYQLLRQSSRAKNTSVGLASGDSWAKFWIISGLWVRKKGKASGNNVITFTVHAFSSSGVFVIRTRGLRLGLIASRPCDLDFSLITKFQMISWRWRFFWFIVFKYAMWWINDYTAKF